MTCAARYPDKQRGDLRGVPLSSCFCILPRGHEGPHFSPIIKDPVEAQWTHLTPAQIQTIFNEAKSEDQRRSKKPEGREAAQADPSVV